MCDLNTTSMLDVNHSTTNDEFNWLSNSALPIVTTDGQLVLTPENSGTTFSRGLGDLEPANDRIRLRINFDILRPQTSTQQTMYVVFGIYTGSTLIDQFSVYKDELIVGEKTEINLDRIYKYDGLSGAVSLRISFVEGWQNHLLLDYTKCENSKFCEDQVRSYFILKNFLEDSLNAVSSGVQLLEYKVDGIETLTPAFFSEINAPGGDLASRKFARANIDGSNRVSNNDTPNTFNPFANDFGLVYDTIDSFHGGKPTATITASDYGTGIMNFGLEKPAVVNGLLESKNGAFFLDIDFSKNLRVVFYAVVNNINTNIFTNPSIFRKYFIIWNADNCTRQFYYQDQLSQNPLTNLSADEDGFLSGLTGGTSKQTAIACDGSFAHNGESGNYEIQINFGTETGMAGINYSLFEVPAKFEVEWNGQVVSSGYVGANYFDQDLINNGVDPSEINTALPSNGTGQLLFFKNEEFPNFATVRIFAPLIRTTWNVSGVCPHEAEPSQFTEIKWEDTLTTEDRVGNLTDQEINYSGTAFPVTDETWQRNDGSGWIDGLTPTTTTNFTLNENLNQFRLKATRVSDSELVYSNVLQYTKTSATVGDVLALRSDFGVLNPDLACPLASYEDVSVWLLCANPLGLPIVTGDKVFNYSQTPFDGQNIHWKIKSASSAVDDPEYVCLVDNLGNITVISTCS